MNYTIHPASTVQKLTIGREQAPLLVIDNLISDAESLVELAATKIFGDVVTYYPGIRAKVPLTYQQFILEQFGPMFAEYFGLCGSQAAIHALPFFARDDAAGEAGATCSVFRTPIRSSAASWRSSTICSRRISGARPSTVIGRRASKSSTKPAAWNTWPAAMKQRTDLTHRRLPTSTAIRPLYEEVCRQQGVFNRMLVYRRNSLHSACLAADFVPDANPRTGRLSVNGFLA